MLHALRHRLGAPSASSYQLMGEELHLLTVDDLRAAVAAHDAAIPDDLRADLVAEELALATESHRWLAKYNRSVYGRIAGYVAIGKRLDFVYPWPVVAVLGILQVIGGMDRVRLYGLAGRIASRLGKVFGPGAESAKDREAGHLPTTLTVHQHPIGWLKAGRVGLVIADWEMAAFALRGMILHAEDEAHRDFLMTMLTPKPPTVVISMARTP